MFDLQRLKADRNLTQTDIAEAIGVKQGYVSRILKGLHPLSDEHIRMLCKIFNISAQDYDVLEIDTEGIEQDPSGGCECPINDFIAGVLENSRAVTDAMKGIVESNALLVKQQTDLIATIRALAEK